MRADVIERAAEAWADAALRASGKPGTGDGRHFTYDGPTADDIITAAVGPYTRQTARLYRQHEEAVRARAIELLAGTGWEPTPTRRPGPPPKGLSPTELREVERLMREGFGLGRIARTIGRSYYTVRRAVA